MGRMCKVKGCTTQGRIQPDGTRIFLYGLSVMEKRNPSGFPALLATIGLPYEKYRDNHGICSRHFSDDAYFPEDLRRFANSTQQASGLVRGPTLKPDAMPTLNMGHEEKSVPQVSRKNVKPGRPSKAKKRKIEKIIIKPKRGRPRKIKLAECGAMTSSLQEDGEDSDEYEECDLKNFTVNREEVPMEPSSFQDLSTASSSPVKGLLDFEKIDIKQEVIDPIKTEPLENFASEDLTNSVPSRMEELPKLSGFIDIVDINDIVGKKREATNASGVKGKNSNYILRMENGSLHPLSRKDEIPDAVPLSEVPSELLFEEHPDCIITSKCNICQALFISESFFKQHVSLNHSEIFKGAFTTGLVYKSIHKQVKLPHPLLDKNPRRVDSSEVSKVNANDLMINADKLSIVNSGDVLRKNSESESIDSDEVSMQEVNSEDPSTNNSQSIVNSDRPSIINSDDVSMQEVNSEDPSANNSQSIVNSDRPSIINSDDVSMQEVNSEDPSTNESEIDSGVLLVINSEDLSRINDQSMDNLKQSDGLSILDINLNEPSTNIAPQFPSDAYKKFYSHFCKYHLDKPERSSLLTIPRLVQPLTNNQLACCECNFARNCKPEVHFFNRHSEDVEKFGSEILQCRVCTNKCHVDILQLAQHLKEHKFHFVHNVKPEQSWQCEECVVLSEKCKELNFMEKSCDVFQFNHITISRKNFVKKMQSLPHGFYFIYSTTPNFTMPVNTNFNCTVCFKSFETLVQLKSHLEMHTDYEFKKCVVCSEKCENMNSYYTHVENNHRNSSELDLDFTYKTKIYDIDNYICLINGCHEKFVNFCSLEYHYVTEHSKKVLENVSPLKCPICSVIFHDQKLLSAHLTLLVSDKPQNCDTQCKVCKIDKENLEQHLLVDHNVRMIFCNICSQNFESNYSQAIFHFKKCYSTIQKFICPFCGFQYENSELLLNHIRIDLQIFNANQLQCKMCLNFFHSKLNLVSHMLNSKCIECDQSFCNYHFLLQHRDEVHS